MAARFSTGKHALGICDVCAGQVKLKTLKEVFRRGKRTGILACRTCWDADHPQNMQGMRPVLDPQAIRNPRPDTSVTASRNIQWGWNPVGMSNPFDLSGLEDMLQGTGQVGTVTISTGG